MKRANIDARKKLEAYIREDGVQAGDRLPPEAVLAKKLGVSRLALRDAIRSLEEEGYLRTVHGVGTFVRWGPNVIDYSLDRNIGVTEMIQAAGLSPGTREVDIELRQADGAISNELGLQQGAAVVVIRRVRTADGDSIAYTEDFIPYEVLGRLPTKDQIGESLYLHMERDLGIRLGSSVARIQAAAAPRSVATALGVPKSTPLLVLEQTDATLEGKPVVFSREWFICGKLKFVIHRRRIMPDVD